MRVLVVGSGPESADGAAHALEAAGHDVVRCHEHGGPAFPCVGLDEQRGCPLDREPVDVVLDVHDADTVVPSLYEDGVSCGIRRNVPVVVVSDGRHPYGRWATSVVGSDDDVVAACVGGASGPLPTHSALATQATREVLEAEGLATDGAQAKVHRSNGMLKVLLSLPWEHPRSSLESMVVASVISAVRGYDASARGVDVEVARRRS